MHAALAGLAAQQGGVFTAAQALTRGYTRDEVRARLASGRWLRVRRGIYRSGAEPADDTAVAIAAAVLACTSGLAVASHGSAAYIRKVPVLERLPRPELTVPAGSPTTAVRGCIVHRGPLTGSHATVNGIRATTLERTAVDLARDRSFAEGVAAVDHILRRGVSIATLEETAHRMRFTPGQAKVRRVLAFADGRAESPGESLARVVFAQHGLPAPELGKPVRAANGRLLGVVDFLWPEHCTAAEFDGRLKYLPDNDRGEDRLWLEKLREDAIRDAGLEVVRVTWAQVTGQPERVVARIRDAFGRAAARLTAS
jgi:predicted transcriptional regulator of viral defense system